MVDGSLLKSLARRELVATMKGATMQIGKSSCQIKVIVNG
jgi:hypothetical protein